MTETETQEATPEAPLKPDEVDVKCKKCGNLWVSKAKPDKIKCPKCKSTEYKRMFSEAGVPYIGGQAKSPFPPTLNVCGNPVKVNQKTGQAEEADPKILRRKRRAAARRRGEQVDETRI